MSSLVRQEVESMVKQALSTVCRADCSSIQSQNTIIVNASEVSGTVGITSTCSANANCIIGSQISQVEEDIISSLSSTGYVSESQAFGNLGSNESTNNAEYKQRINNYLTQLMNSTCTANVFMTQTNNLIVATTNGSVSGFVGLRLGSDVPASANAACTINNVARISAYNKALVSNNAPNNITPLIIIVGIVIAVIVIVILFTILRRKKVPIVSPPEFDRVVVGTDPTTFLRTQ